MAFERTTDEDFAAFAKKKEAEAAEREERKNSGGMNFQYEDVKHVPIAEKGATVVRFLGNPPDRRKNPTDPKEFWALTLKNDKGRKVHIRLPLRDAISEKDHVMWRLYDRVMEKDWGADRKPVFVNEQRFPDLYALVAKGGYTLKDGESYQYAKGWKGQQTVLCNVIDRSIYSWHKEHKHSALLVKNVTFDTNDKGETIEYADAGVPSYGFLNKFNKLFTQAGSWEKYDVIITRTGEKTNPYDIQNASRLKEGGITEMLGGKEDLIVTGGLTDEELSWDRYDIDKLGGVSTYTKILHNFSGLLKLCDADLHTTFFDEVSALAEKEKQERLNSADAESDSEPAQASAAPAAEAQEAPAVPRTPAAARAAKTSLSADKIALLKGWSVLTDEEKAMILDVQTVDGHVKCTYSPDAGDCAACTISAGGCGADSPVSFKHCPVCGAKF